MADVFDWSATAGSNSTVDGINIATGMSPGNVDNALRSIMAIVRNTFVPSWEGLFAGTTSGIPVSNGSGTIATKVAPVGFIVGTTDAQTLTNKTLSGATISSLAAALPVGSGGTGQTTAAAALNALMSGALTGGATSGTLNLGVFKLSWKDITASANGATAVTYHTAFSSWSRAWCNGVNQNAGAQDNGPAVISGSETTSGCSIFSAVDSGLATTVFAFGV